MTASVGYPGIQIPGIALARCIHNVDFKGKVQELLLPDFQINNLVFLKTRYKVGTSIQSFISYGLSVGYIELTKNSN